MSNIIKIKSSTTVNAPLAGSLQQGELAVSLQSGKLFIGDELAGVEVIGGKAYTDLFSTIIAEDGSTTYGSAQANSVLVLGADKEVDTIDIGTLLLNGTELTATADSLNILTGFSDVVTDNTLSSVSDTTLVSSKAIKDYVYERTQAAVSTFEFTDAAVNQLLIAGADGVFANKDVTGVLEIYSDGSTDIVDGTVINRHIANDTIANEKLVNKSVTLGTQTVALGESIVLNRNTDLAGVSAVNWGGTGLSDIADTQLMIGNGTGAVETSANLTYNSETSAFGVTGTSTFTGDVAVSGNETVGGTLEVTGATTLSDTLAVTGASTLTGAVVADSTVDVSGATTLGSTLDVSGATTLSSTLAVTGTSTLTGAVTAQSNLSVVGNETVGGTLGVTGATTLSDTLDVSGDTTITGAVVADSTLDVSGNTTVGGTLSVTGNVSTDGNLTVSGDLFVSGNTVQIDVQSMTIEDNIIVMANGNNANATDVGVAAKYSLDGNNTLYTGFFRDATSSEFVFYDGYTTTPGLTMDGFSEETMLATIRANIIAPSVDIQGGTIDSVTLTSCVIDGGTF